MLPPFSPIYPQQIFAPTVPASSDENWLWAANIKLSFVSFPTKPIMTSWFGCQYQLASRMGNASYHGYGSFMYIEPALLQTNQLHLGSAAVSSLLIEATKIESHWFFSKIMINILSAALATLQDPDFRCQPWGRLKIIRRAVLIRPKAQLVQHSCFHSGQPDAMGNPQVGPDFDGSLPTCDFLQLIFQRHPAFNSRGRTVELQNNPEKCEP